METEKRQRRNWLSFLVYIFLVLTLQFLISSTTLLTALLLLTSVYLFLFLLFCFLFDNAESSVPSSISNSNLLWISFVVLFQIMMVLQNVDLLYLFLYCLQFPTIDQVTALFLVLYLGVFCYHSMYSVFEVFFISIAFFFLSFSYLVIDVYTEYCSCPSKKISLALSVLVLARCSQFPFCSPVYLYLLLTLFMKNSLLYQYIHRFSIRLGLLIVIVISHISSA